MKRECATTTNSCVASYALDLSHQIEALEPKIASAIRASVSSALTQAIDRFARWIVEPLEAERAAIDLEREKLDHLQTHHRRLSGHDTQLASLIKAAADASAGIGG